MAELKGRREVERRGGFCDRLANFGAAMPGVAAPEARRPVEDRPSVGALIVHSVRRHDLARVRLEPAIGGEGHLEVRQLVVVTPHCEPPLRPCTSPRRSETSKAVDCFSSLAMGSEAHTSARHSLMRLSYAV